MSENQGGTINLLPQTEQKKNGLNGKNGTNGSKSMGAESIYFKVAIPKQIIKRDGRIVSFDAGRIQVALERCFSSLANPPKTSVEDLTQQVVNVVAAKYDLPTVE
ncbi:MAG: ATP cone domain-containing protein, partial [Candidatus Promineifilaceae bacterium]